MEMSEKLETVISEGLDSLDPNDENYCKQVEAVKNLYDLKLKEETQANDYYIRASEVDNRSLEIDKPWWKDINPNTVINVVAMTVGTLVTLKYEKDGYLFRPGDFLRGLIHK